MANRVFEVFGEDGKAEGTLIAPQGGSLRQELESGGKVYKPNREDEETYVPISEAKATTTIDPVSGTITVKGPSWLTSDIIILFIIRTTISIAVQFLSLIWRWLFLIGPA